MRSRRKIVGIILIFVLLMWIPFETTNFWNRSHLEQRNLSCFLEIHMILVSFGIYIKF